MRALKILVVVMGVLIIGGTLTLVALIVQRAGSSASHSGHSEQSGPWEAALDQPEGSRIAGIASAEGALAVWVARPDGERILLLDPRRGRVSGEIRLGR